MVLLCSSVIPHQAGEEQAYPALAINGIDLSKILGENQNIGGKDGNN